MKTYDLVGIGNAVVDVISQTDDNFLANMDIEKGIMQLVERERAEILYGAMKDRVQTPGGSVANTIAGAGALGMQTAFIGRVRDDTLGNFYASAMADHGIDFVNPPVAQGEAPTSRSMIFVTPDGERSMNTYLGISTGLTSADVPEAVTGNARLMFLEGYLFDHDAGKTAFREAARATKAGGGKAGIAISDPFCVERHRADFLSLIEGDLEVADLEGAWNDRFAADFGFAVDKPSHGLLQDVHWSEGLFGYFPTYSLGNVYAGCLHAALRDAIPDLDDDLARGDTSRATGWLRDNVQRHGGLYQPREVITRAAGAAPAEAPLLDYLEAKFGAIYRL